MGVVLDSSILLNVEEKKVDVFKEILFLLGNVDFVIPSPVLEEIKKLAKNKGKRGIKAKVALMLIEKYKDKIRFVEEYGKVDEVVLRVGEKERIIATSDKAMKNRALRKGLKVVMLVGKKLEVI